MKRGAFVSWVPSCGRSQGFIDALGLAPIYSSFLGQRDLASAPLKYALQFVDTLRALVRLRPDVVFVMNPPVFAVLAVALYTRTTGTKYAMDCHSGAFESAKWRWTLPLQRWLGRHAAAVMVTNPVHFDRVRAWPAPALIVADPPPMPSGKGRLQSALAGGEDGGFVFVIATYAPDEAIPEVIEVARAMPSVRFRISGDTARAPRAVRERRPPNVELTGFVPLPTFWQYAQSAAAILTLTHQENTILRGAWEAMFVGRPLITSDTAALRNYFERGTRFVDNTVAGIMSGIEEVLAKRSEFQAGMEQLRSEKQLQWQREQGELEALLKVSFAAAAMSGISA